MSLGRVAKAASRSPSGAFWLFSRASHPPCSRPPYSPFHCGMPVLTLWICRGVQHQDDVLLPAHSHVHRHFYLRPGPRAAARKRLDVCLHHHRAPTAAAAPPPARPGPGPGCCPGRWPLRARVAHAATFESWSLEGRGCPAATAGKDAALLHGVPDDAWVLGNCGSWPRMNSSIVQALWS
jgi:hypothetical protein